MRTRINLRGLMLRSARSLRRQGMVALIVGFLGVVSLMAGTAAPASAATNYPGTPSPCMTVKDNKGKVKASVWLTSTWARSRNAKKQSVTRPVTATLHVTGQAVRAGDVSYTIPGHKLAEMPALYIVQPGQFTYRMPSNLPWALNKGHGSAAVHIEVELEYNASPLWLTVTSAN